MLNRLLLVANGGGGFASPFIASGAYPSGFRGDRLLTQLHCHTTSSDGSYAPADVVAGYLAAGYDVLAITDHDTVTSQPDGIATEIVANELSPAANHIISLNSSYTRGATTDAQTLIDGVRGAGGEAHLAHPNWSIGLTYAEMAALTGYLGIEIHNAYASTLTSSPSTDRGLAIDRWDALLTNVRRNVWGMAVDDLHVLTSWMTYDVSRLQVFARTPAVADVMAALVAGNFVADVSNFGVTPAYPQRSNAGVELACQGATRIEAWGSAGLIASSIGTSISHEWDGLSSYVRLVAVGDYAESFDSLSDRWAVVDGSWSATGGVLALSSDSTIRRIVLRRHLEGAFTAQVDVKLGTGGTDHGALLFNFLNSDCYYMIRIGESAVPSFNNQLAIGKTTDDEFLDGEELDAFAFNPDSGTWYTVKMDYTAAGRIRAKIWERGASEPGSWQVDATDATWTHGAFGFRGNRTVEFDNLYIDGFKTYYQPIAID